MAKIQVTILTHVSVFKGIVGSIMNILPLVTISSIKTQKKKLNWMSDLLFSIKMDGDLT